MRRLLLIVLAIMLACPAGWSEENAYDPERYEKLNEWESEHLKIFWTNLIYQGEPVDINVPPPGYESLYDDYGYAAAYMRYFYEKYVACDIYEPNKTCNKLSWMGMEFSFIHHAPNSFGRPMQNPIINWADYFSEMYHAGGRSIWYDENGFNPFWDGLRCNGEPVDPYTPPPDYDPSMDYWAELRPVIGYAWHWNYYFINHCMGDEEVVLEWNGIRCLQEQYPDAYYDAVSAATTEELIAIQDEFHGVNLYVWEAYFNNMYYENLNG